MYKVHNEGPGHVDNPQSAACAEMSVSKEVAGGASPRLLSNTRHSFGANVKATQWVFLSSTTMQPDTGGHSHCGDDSLPGNLCARLRGGAGELKTLLFLFTGEGAHSDLTDIASLKVSPSWLQLEATLQRLDVGPDLEVLLRAHLGVHAAPLSPVITTIINILNFDRWGADGVTPTHVLGHSIGEVAAAYAASMLTRQEALHACVVLGHLGAKCGGAMLHTKVPQSEVLSWPAASQLAIAAINGFASLSAADGSDPLLGVSLCGPASEVPNLALCKA